MRRLGDISLKAKLVSFAVFVTLFSLGSAFVFLVTRDARVFRSDVEERTTLIARVVGDYSSPDLVFRDRKASRETLGLLKGVPAVLYAAVYDPAGNLFSAYRKTEGVVIPVSALKEGSQFQGSVLHVVQPVPVPGEKGGWIRVGVSTEELQSRIRAHLYTTLLVVLGILAIAVLIALWLQRLISEPILELVSTTRKISRSPDYSLRVKKKGDDEIGGLCDAFNEMLRQIERREEDRERADRRTQEKSLFLAHMSHELRTPLNSIIGFSDVLEQSAAEKLSSRELRFLANINSSGRHLLRLISGILDLSKVEAGEMTLELSTFPLRSTVEDVVTVMKGITDPREVVISVTVPEGLPDLTADEVRVKQILYNLLSNAVKFSPVKSEVSVAVRFLEGRFEISVTDRGCGISEKDQWVIFQEFRQLDASESRRFEGTGLGLALVKSFVELHGGEIRVKSQLSHGSTFTVILPERPPEPPPSPGKS